MESVVCTRCSPWQAWHLAPRQSSVLNFVHCSPLGVVLLPPLLPEFGEAVSHMVNAILGVQSMGILLDKIDDSDMARLSAFGKHVSKPWYSHARASGDFRGA